MRLLETSTAPGGLPLELLEALKRAAAAELEQRPTRLSRRRQGDLRRAGLTYTCHRDGRDWIHLTPAGRQALAETRERNPQ